MIPYNPFDAHVEAFGEWRKALRNAKTFPQLRRFFCEQALRFHMEYETAVAQLVVAYENKLKGEQS